MNKRSFAAVVFAGLLSVGGVGPIFAQDMLSGADAIAKRQELMKANGGILKALGGMSGEEAVTAGQTLVDNFAALADLWPEDSQTGDTKVLPNIWTDSEGFMTAFLNASTAAAGVLAAAQSGDAAALGSAAKTLGGTCGACHQTYRVAQ